MTANKPEISSRNDKLRWGLTIFLGMLVTLWRVVLPTNVEITTGIVILVAVLDMILVAAVVWINRVELKELIIRKFAVMDFLKIILCYVIFFVFTIMTDVVLAFSLTLATGGMEAIASGDMFSLPEAPAQSVANEFRRLFPVGIVISTVIAAPIWEEIVFRMAAKNLLRNGFLFVVVNSLLFGFIHTGSFITLGIIPYILSGIGFSVIYLITKDLRLVICVHALWNIIAMVIGFLS